jgi:hypothetical protein
MSGNWLNFSRGLKHHQLGPRFLLSNLMQPHVSIKIIGNRTLVTFFAQIPAKCVYF